MNSYQNGTTDEGSLRVLRNNLFCPQPCRSKLFPNPEQKHTEAAAVSQGTCLMTDPRQGLWAQSNTSVEITAKAACSSVKSVSVSCLLSRCLLWHHRQITAPCCTQLALGKATENKYAKCCWEQKEEGRNAELQRASFLICSVWNKKKTPLWEWKGKSDWHSWECAITAGAGWWFYVFWTTGRGKCESSNSVKALAGLAAPCQSKTRLLSDEVKGCAGSSSSKLHFKEKWIISTSVRRARDPSPTSFL